MVYRARGHGTEGVQSPGTSNCITEADHRPANTTVPASRVRSLDVRTTAKDVEAATGRSQESPEEGGNGLGSTTGAG